MLNSQVQVHTVEGLDCSVAHGEISRFIITSDIHFLVYALLMIIQSFEKSTFSKTKFAQEIVPQNQGISDKRLLRMNAKLDSSSALALSLELKKDKVQLQREMLQ